MIRISVSGETPTAQLDRIGRTLAQAITLGIAGATEGAKLEMRRTLQTGKYDFSKAANAIRGDVYPKPPKYSPRLSSNMATPSSISADAVRVFLEGWARPRCLLRRCIHNSS